MIIPDVVLATSEDGKNIMDNLALIKHIEHIVAIIIAVLYTVIIFSIRTAMLNKLKEFLGLKVEQKQSGVDGYFFSFYHHRVDYCLCFCGFHAN